MEQLDIFDQALAQVGNSGKFQNWYNIIYNFIFGGFATMAFFNVYICLATPEHWCHVPGREFTNYTIEQWKNFTIPGNSNTSNDFSQCTSFRVVNDTIDRDSTIECESGWEYDKTYFIDTMISQENWVCKDAILSTNMFLFGRIGEVLGTAFAQIGDIYGRKFVLYFSIISMVIGRLGFLFSTGSYWLYCVFMLIGSLANLALFQSILVISFEISRNEDRGKISLVQLASWSGGLAFTPILYWLLGKWIPFLIITTIPILPFLFVPKFNIESPRWLLTRGQTKRCIKQLRRIAKINKNDVSENVFESLFKHPEITIPEKSYGIMSMFSSKSLAMKSILLIISWMMYTTIYNVLFINISNLKGNPFVNYFWQGLAELPGFLIGKYLSDTIGRKLTNSSSFTFMAGIAAIQAYTFAVEGNTVITSVCGAAMKLGTSITYYALNLQTLEIFPTCLRQTGSSITQMAGSIFGIVSPYLIYLGTTIHLSLPYIAIAVLALTGGIFNMFLPETLNEKLPETMAEAESFGKEQKFWPTIN